MSILKMQQDELNTCTFQKQNIAIELYSGMPDTWEEKLGESGKSGHSKVSLYVEEFRKLCTWLEQDMLRKYWKILNFHFGLLPRLSADWPSCWSVQHRASLQRKRGVVGCSFLSFVAVWCTLVFLLYVVVILLISSFTWCPRKSV